MLLCSGSGPRRGAFVESVLRDVWEDLLVVSTMGVEYINGIHVVGSAAYAKKFWGTVLRREVGTSLLPEFLSGF